MYFGDTEPKAMIFMPFLDSELILFTGRHMNMLPHDILHSFPLISPSRTALNAFVLLFMH